MKLIIPGASGFLGVNLLTRLVTNKKILDAFDSIQIVDVLQYGNQKIPEAILNHPKIDFMQASIYEPSTFSNYLLGSF